MTYMKRLRGVVYLPVSTSVGGETTQLVRFKDRVSEYHMKIWSIYATKFLLWLMNHTLHRDKY